MSNNLEWNSRSGYALTELVLFLITALIVTVTVALSFILSFLHLTKRVSFFSTLRPLFENVLPSAIAFTAVEKSPGKSRISVVFLGYQERIQRNKCVYPLKLDPARIWVHVYFTLLCGLIMVWAVAVFSDSVLYKKTSSCTDLSVQDTDLSCFLLSSRNIPEGVQQIIEKEEGDLVPCEDVQRFIQSHNISLDLEVICYEYQLNPLAALGVSYGAMKSIAFTIITTLGIILGVTNKLRERLFHKDVNVENRFSSFGNQQDDSTDYPSPKVISRGTILAVHALQLMISIFLILIIAILLAILHNDVSGAKNSGLDYLRGEQFYRYYVTVLIPITIIFTLGLFPWWAFYPLDNPKWKSGELTDKEIANKIHKFVHNIVLHHKFSTGFDALLTTVKGAIEDQIPPDKASERWENMVETEDKM